MMRLTKLHEFKTNEDDKPAKEKIDQPETDAKLTLRPNPAPGFVAANTAKQNDPRADNRGRKSSHFAMPAQNTATTVVSTKSEIKLSCRRSGFGAESCYQRTRADN